MEPQKTSTKPITKILKFLPRATSSVSFQNPPVYSPSKDKKTSEKTHKSNLGIGFSGPMASIVPSDNRHNLINNKSTYTFVYEPTSPRVSCMGTVKCKHYRKLAAAAAAANATSKHKHTNKFISQTTSSSSAVIPPVKTCKNQVDDQEKVVTKKKASIRSLFRGGSRRKNSDEKSTTITTTITTLPKAPSLGKMKRFSSGRDAFTNFDWTTQVTPLDSADHKKYFTDDDERDGGEEEIKIPSSAPVMERNKGFCENFVRVGGVNNLEPRKEINLWKRRTMAQPMPLQLHAAEN